MTLSCFGHDCCQPRPPAAPCPSVRASLGTAGLAVGPPHPPCSPALRRERPTPAVPPQDLRPAEDRREREQRRAEEVLPPPLGERSQSWGWGTAGTSAAAVGSRWPPWPGGWWPHGPCVPLLSLARGVLSPGAVWLQGPRCCVTNRARTGSAWGLEPVVGLDPQSAPRGAALAGQASDGLPAWKPAREAGQAAWLFSFLTQISQCP